MINFYLINLAILILLIYRVIIGVKGGLFSESVNLVNVLFAAGASFTFIEPMSSYVQRYLHPEKNYAMIIAFWSLFLLFFLCVWILKQVSLSKVENLVGKRNISFPVLLERIGGAVCGLYLGTILSSIIMLSLYIAPATNKIYQFHRENKIIFRVDEAFPRFYSSFTKIFTSELEKFNWEEFMEGLAPDPVQPTQPTQPEKFNEKKFMEELDRRILPERRRLLNEYYH